MSSRGAFTLAEIAAKLTMLEVACSRCERRGRLSLARLIEQHGAEASLGDLREVIAHGCPASCRNVGIRPLRRALPRIAGRLPAAATGIAGVRD
jgi:hypothetical protein